MRRHFGLFLLIAFLALNVLLAQAAPTANGIIRVSNNTSGTVSEGWVYGIDISRDGQYIVLDSEADDLINGDTNAERDIFLYTVATGTLERISEPSPTGEPNGWSREPSISETGLYTAFSSTADNLIAGDTNGFSDIFVYNRTAQTFRMVSIASDGTKGNFFSYNPAISANGRFIAFGSYSTNLALPTPTAFNQWQVYLHDRNPDKDSVWDEPGQILTIPISVNNNGELANNFAGTRGRLAVSDDGMIVAFVSLANNLVPNDTNGVDDVFVHLRDPDHNNVPDEPGKIETVRISVSTSGAQGDLDSYDVQMSADGEWILFNSEATNLVAGDTNGRADAFLHQLSTGITTRISVSSSGAQNPGDSYGNDISASGQHIVFHANQSALTNPTCVAILDCVYRYDRLAGVTQLITFEENGAPSGGHTYQPVISASGDRIAFLSENGYLDGNDSNNVTNAYLWISPVPANLTNHVYVPMVVKN